MRFLHTADWHLGRALYGRKRYDEFSQFLDWLLVTIQKEGIEALLIAGDVFDSKLPSNQMQELYYRFLCNVAHSSCRHVLIIAGNHDSPSFLNAPKELLRAIHVSVVGAITENLEDELILLKNQKNQPQAIICAVPYLRDKDIRSVEPGERLEDKNAKLIEGLKNHYHALCQLAEQKQRTIKEAGQGELPIIAMGHLFTAGGKTQEGDGVRELYVGSLARISQESFPRSIDYLALGHLHISQCVGGQANKRYSGSPIPMGYGEAQQRKKVIIIDFKGRKPSIQEQEIPCFQELQRLSGSCDEIRTQIEELKKKESRAWLEIDYNGTDIIGKVRDMLNETLAQSSMEIRRIKSKQSYTQINRMISNEETLQNLTLDDVFDRCLESFAVPPEEHKELKTSYKEIILALQQEDGNAE